MEETINRLTIDAPMVMRSVKTRTAARIMVERFREATEMLAENVSMHIGLFLSPPFLFGFLAGYFASVLSYLLFRLSSRVLWSFLLCLSL